MPYEAYVEKKFLYRFKWDELYMEAPCRCKWRHYSVLSIRFNAISRIYPYYRSRRWHLQYGFWFDEVPSREIMKGYQKTERYCNQARMRPCCSPTWIRILFLMPFAGIFPFPCCIGHAGNDFEPQPSCILSRKREWAHPVCQCFLDSEPQEAEFYDIFNALFEFDLRP